MNVLKLLFNPIFLMAAGLHAGLLLIPVAGGSSEDLVPAPDPEGESISVTRIPPKADQPAKPGTGPSAAPQGNRPTTPTTTTQVAAIPGKPPSTSANRQQPTQGNSTRSQGSQRSSNGRNASTNSNGSNSSGRTSRNSSSSSQTARNNSPSGLPDLPSNTPNSVPVTVPSEGAAVQKPPTLTALSEGINSQRVPQLLKDFLARLQYSLQDTRDLATAEAQSAWLAKLEAEQPNLDVSAPQALEKAIEISYPLTIEDNGPRQINGCLNPLPKTGLIGVVVDEDSQIIGEPTLLRSSGYPLLNDMALGKMKDYAEFPNETTQKIYTVPVAVNYDAEACVSLTKLGVVPSETTTETSDPPIPPEGGRNFLEEDDSPSPFGR
ncbi:MAG: hypothetical protein KTR27_17890 [Leptolyngbyaceae cyanobacterium MAG.088]|nr:hypothetical protein [Leptolyngbyaceae cyanobacterium MAG.088]